MGKIALLLPTEDMRMTAHNYCQQHPEYPVKEIRVIHSENAVAEARTARADGADIIVARGLQAEMIQKYTEIPLIRIVITAQEMALLVMKAKNTVKKDRPIIGVCGFASMFCDMSFFNELYDVELRTYFATSEENLADTVREAVADGVDVVIGGETAVQVCFESNTPSLFLATTEDSLQQALGMALNLDYAISVEKKNAAELETVLDYSYSGIIRVDTAGLIRNVNMTMEQMVDISASALTGKRAVEQIPGLTAEELSKVLRSGQEHALMLEWNRVSFYVVMAPIVFDKKVDGALLTFHRTQKAQTKKRENVRNTDLAPRLYFDDIYQKSEKMKACMDLARLYAMSDQPIVLLGEVGTERRMIAQAMHSASERRNHTFLDVSCAGLDEQQQFQLLFAEKGAILQAQGGTILIQDIDCMTIANQYRLYRLIRFRVAHGQDVAQLRTVDVRLMVTSARPLGELLREGKIREDLYYLLAGLELTVPPLRERPEDLEYHLDYQLKELFHKYGRYHVLTAGARKYLREYPWPGNLFQLERFCERLILTAGKRSIDEVMITDLLSQLYGSGDEEAEAGDPVYESHKEEILNTLRQFHGNRERTAEALGISTTTLWRQMKKYGVKLR